ncbi:YbaK/EbsC family protein [Aestuariibacter sp. AA17]|uniref:YbaK/EbsC family protein n=1 Tax=Fluctibacter corallii TaxID=2984329 RepID=A0ABT3A833_9ALTE|nr:YbaK/EbsC family protein [Aestuariibacter sp. AA17]MCV2884841.1 YbaK/EbsC family protein [Aestuariibacter sp. AA17]
MSGLERTTHYLDSQHIRYGLVSHPHSKSSVGSAISAEIPMHQLAKAILLEDHEGKHLMAIIPADYKLNLHSLNDTLNRSLKLVKEAKVYQLFTDCDSGAVPPIPNAYHMDAIYDDSLTKESQLYLEAGDHETLIQLEKDDFRRLMSKYQHGRISDKVIH